MCKVCALPLAPTPLSDPPPNISRGGLTVDHTSSFNVRRGGGERAKLSKKRCPLPGLIRHVRPKHAQKLVQYRGPLWLLFAKMGSMWTAQPETT